MSDLISRKAAIKALTEAYENIDAEWILNKLPSAKDTDVHCKWNKIHSRPMDAEEREYWERMHDCDFSDGVIYTNIPDDGQKVLVCYYNGAIDIDEFFNDTDGCYFDSNGEIEGIVAWMPLPEPYKEEVEE